MRYVYYNKTSGQTRPSGGSLRVVGICQLVGHRLVVPLLLRPQLVMHWLVMHALAKDSPGLPGVVSVTDPPCVHAIYMEDHRRQTTDSCKKLMASVCETTPLSFFFLRFGIALAWVSCSHLRERLRYGYFLPKSKMADGRFILDFRRALLGSSLFQHVYNLMLRRGTECDVWERLGAIRQSSREEFADNGWGSSFVLAA